MSFAVFFVIFWIIMSFTWVRINVGDGVRSKLWSTLEHILILPYTVIMIVGLAFQIISINLRSYFDKSNESDTD